MRVPAVIAAAALGLSVFAGSADATVRTFFTPTIEGERLAFCASTGTHCGKPVADAWCRFNGYGDALLFQREGGLKPEFRALHADTGGFCTGGSCLAFREIKCRAAG